MYHKTEQEIMKNWEGDKSKPVVSVCTITYNHEKYISKAINSFLMQETNFPFEVVIGEDCSLDKTRKIIEEYVEKYPNIIRLIISKANVGMQKNVKRSMEACKGEYIAFCEGDDYWTDEKKLQLQLYEMKKYPEIYISFHPTYELMNGKNRDVLSQHSKENKIFTTSEVILGDGGFMPTNSIIVKKEIVDNLPTWFHTDAPVGDYFIQIFGTNKAGALYINRIMGIYRIQHEGSWSHHIKKNEDNKIFFIEKMKKVMKYLDRDLDYKYSNQIKQYIKKITWNIILNRNISIQSKKIFFNKNRAIFSNKQKLLWYFVFSNSNIDKILRFLYDKGFKKWRKIAKN